MLSDDGKKAEFDSPENLKALKFMVDGINNGAAPKAVTTYMEEESRRAFENGDPAFMRNWPYAYAAGKTNKNAPDFEVAPFPTFEGGGKAGILGGHNKVISVYTENPGVVARVRRLRDEPRSTRSRSAAEVLASAGAVRGVRRPEGQEGAAVLGPSSSRRSSRPSPARSRRCTRRSREAIYKNVNAALSGEVSPEEALKTGQSQMEQALATF